MKKRNEPTEANIFRMDMGCRLLEILEENEELPMPNIYRLTKTMHEYFVRFGMIDEIKENGYRWKPDADYWRQKMSDITGRMRTEKNRYFGYTHKPGRRFSEGDWKFMTPEEWQRSLKLNHAGIGTRVDTQNQKIEESVDTYRVELPTLAEVPLLN